MKILETIEFDDLMSTGGIFSKVQSVTGQPFEWLTSTLALELDNIYYLEHSGDKTISPYYRRLSEKAVEDDSIDVLGILANAIITKFADKWNKLYSAFISSDYNPLENYRMEQTETPDITKESTKNVGMNVTTETENSSELDVYGFNSTVKVPSQEASGGNSVTMSGDKVDNETTVSETETGTRELERHGNIGVTTSQQMLQSEIDLRNHYNFVENIMKDVDSVLALKIYC